MLQCEKPFTSVPVLVKTYENDTVLLPCYVDDTGMYETESYQHTGSIIGHKGLLGPPQVTKMEFQIIRGKITTVHSYFTCDSGLQLNG